MERSKLNHQHGVTFQVTLAYTTPAAGRRLYLTSVPAGVERQAQSCVLRRSIRRIVKARAPASGQTAPGGFRGFSLFSESQKPFLTLFQRAVRVAAHTARNRKAECTTGAIREEAHRCFFPAHPLQHLTLPPAPRRFSALPSGNFRLAFPPFSEGHHAHSRLQHSL